MSIQKQAAELLSEWEVAADFNDKSGVVNVGNLMAALLRQIASIGGDVEPEGYLCEWSGRIGMPNNQVFYYGERGSAIEDDWNRQPDVHKNLPLFTQQALDAARLAGFEAGRRKGLEDAASACEEHKDDTQAQDLCRLGAKWCEASIRELINKEA